MENTAVAEHISEVNWKEVGTTAAIVLFVGFGATLAALVVHDMYKEHKAKKASEKKDDSAKK